MPDLTKIVAGQGTVRSLAAVDPRQLTADDYDRLDAIIDDGLPDYIRIQQVLEYYDDAQRVRRTPRDILEIHVWLLAHMVRRQMRIAAGHLC